ncbi:MAG: hypothetical protein PHN49_11005 [Candidatus Omnitrophica bacterium]|nr:hypothetical protein [Candidatus Omnitrophota bacterium]
MCDSERRIKSIVVTLVFLLVWGHFPGTPPLDARRVDRVTYQYREREKDLKENLARFSAGHFEILTDQPMSKEYQEVVRKVIRNASQTVDSDFGYMPDDTMEILLLSTPTYRQVSDPRLSSGGFYANKKIRIRINIDLSLPAESLGLKLQETFLHEYTHLVICASDGGRTPRWLEEGLAEYEERGKGTGLEDEGQSFVRYMESRGKKVETAKFFKKDLWKQYRESGRDFYSQSYVIAKHLVEKYGFEKLRELLSTMKKGSAFTTAFRRIYGITPEELATEAYQN